MASSSRPASRATSIRVNKDPSNGLNSASNGGSNSRSAVQLQLPPIHLIHAEITAVTSAMRKFNRFSASSSGSSSNFSNPSTLQSTSSIALTRPAVHAASNTLQGLGGLSQQNPQQQEQAKKGDQQPSSNTPLALSMGLRGLRSNQNHNQNGKDSGSGSVAPARQDDTPAGLLAGFTILRAQLREHPGEFQSETFM